MMRQIFNKLDSTNDGVLTYDNLMNIDPQQLNKREREIYNLILVAYFGLENNVNEPCSYQEFCQIIGQYKSEQKSCQNKNEQQQHQQQVRESLERIPQFNCIMPLQQDEIQDANKLISEAISTSKRNGSINISSLLGLRQRDSLDTIQTKEQEQLSLQKCQQGDFITEQELSTFLDQVAQQGINITTLLSNEQIQNHKKEIEDVQQESDGNKLVSKLLIQDFDYTHSGNLNLLEKSNLLALVDKEIKAHKQFLGMNLKIIGNYIIGRTLGFGKTSIVKAAVRKDIDRLGSQIQNNQEQQVALKIIPYKPLTIGEQAYRMLDKKYCKQISEIQVLYQCDNENIIKLLNTFEHIDNYGQKWTVLCLQLCGGGTLQEYRNSTRISESICRYLFYHIVLGINYLHHMKIAHMDIRLENILIDNEGEAKIADLGSCVSWQDSEQDLIKAGSISGTISTMSPEMLQMDEDFSAIKSDCWQLGLVLYELLTGKPAFRQKVNDNTVISRIINCKYNQLDQEFSQEARDLIDHLICYDPNERYTTTEILNHPWFDKDMHKPAIAKGIIVLQNNQSKSDVQNYLLELMKQENITVNDLLITKDIIPTQVGGDTITRFQKLKCKTSNGIIFTLQTDEIVHNQGQQTSINESSEYTQTNEKLENRIINKVTEQNQIIKVTVFMNSGMLQSFQTLFRRLRYLILLHYNVAQNVDTRHDENPAYDIVNKNEESQSKQPSISLRPASSINERLEDITNSSK